MNTIHAGPFLLVGILIVVIMSLYTLLKKRAVNKVLFYSIFVIYFLILISCVWFPMYIQAGLRQLYGLVQPIPFYTIMKSLSSGDIFNIGREICANILMTVPYGIMVPFLFKQKKRWKYVLNMFGLPLAIELSQFLWCIALDSHYRMADIDDVLLNAFGIFIGYVIYRYFPEKIRKFFEF